MTQPSWDGTTTTDVARQSPGRHGHLYYNRGGNYRGYELISAACHSQRTTVKLWLLGWAESAKVKVICADIETGRSVSP